MFYLGDAQSHALCLAQAISPCDKFAQGSSALVAVPGASPLLAAFSHKLYQWAFDFCLERRCTSAGELLPEPTEADLLAYLNAQAAKEELAWKEGQATTTAPASTPEPKPATSTAAAAATAATAVPSKSRKTLYLALGAVGVVVVGAAILAGKKKKP